MDFKLKSNKISKQNKISENKNIFLEQNINNKKKNIERLRYFSKNTHVI